MTSQRTNHFGCLLLLIAGTVAAGPPACAQRNMADPEVAVEEGARALRRSPRPPWYDAEQDAFRPAEVEPPATPWSGPDPTLAFWMMIIGWTLLAALLVWLVWLVIRAYLNRESQSAVRFDRGPVGGDISRVEELPVALQTSPEDYLREAERLYRRGEYGPAIIYLFSHQLLQLDRRHWIRLIKGKTNRQYLRELRRSAAPSATELTQILSQTVLLFEEVFFGKRVPDRQRVDTVWQQIDTFEALVQVPEEQAA